VFDRDVDTAISGLSDLGDLTAVDETTITLWIFIPSRSNDGSEHLVNPLQESSEPSRSNTGVAGDSASHPFRTRWLT